MTPGTRLGPYEVLAPIGSGGMGEVYRARDTRLGRDVAIKVSKEQFSERFEREARAVAALNHPNICHLYDVGPNYLVMELIEGETLRGPLPLDAALDYARQIAEALEAAHEKGITHRDLKPANIKITPQGVVKVLDFGLAAVAQASAGDGSNAANSPTLTMSPTMAGMILGTAAYMSPEQARGKPVDKRADIWAFGVVLYEMLTGEQVFKGDDLTEILASVVKEPPDLSKAPLEVHRLLRKCLEKDPRKRLRDIGDVWELLDGRPSFSPQGTSATQFNRWLWRSATAVSLIVAASLAFLHFREPVLDRHAYRLQLEPPEDGQFVPGGTQTGGFAISPDGRTAAYVANVQGKSNLWVQPLDGIGRMLPATEDASFPFWSPDNKSIAYFAKGKLLRTNIAGGTPLVLCDVRSQRGGAWSADGRIVFGTFPGTGIYQVAESGGTPSALTRVDASSEANHFWPQVLPGGRLLYWNAGSNPETRGAFAVSLSKPNERVRLVAAESNALSAPGGDGKNYLLWLRGAALLAQEFAPDSLRFSGSPQVIANPVGTSGNTAYMQAVVSENGVLIYHASALTRFTWFDRAGGTHGTVGEAGDYGTFRLSPDGRRVAASRLTAGGSELWMLDLDRGISSPFSTGPRSHAYPVWSRDSKAIVFEGPTSGLTRKAISGTEKEQSLHASEGLQIPYDWSHDGRFILYSYQQRIWILPVTPDGKPAPDVKPKPYLEGVQNRLRFSPEANPRWVAYDSSESGRSEVYVESFPEPHGPVRVSNAGGRWPEWNPEGRELFYVSADNKLMVVSLRLGATFEPSTPRELFALPSADTAFSQYDVGADGQRFLVRTPAEQASRSLTVIVNWSELLKQKPQMP